MASPTLSVIIPAFNEAEQIPKSLAETCRVLQNTEYEIIVVDDGSSDTTAAEALAFANHERRVLVLTLPGNRGKGAALIHGCKHAQGELIAFLDADLELHPSLLLRLWRAMVKTQADAVIGSKHHPESKIHYPTLRYLTSGIYARLVKFLFNLNVKDTQTGIKLFRAESLQLIIPNLKIERFAFDLELLVAMHRSGLKVVESPVEVKFLRKHGGRLKLPAMIEMFIDTLRLYIRTNREFLPQGNGPLPGSSRPIPPPPVEG